MKRNLSLATCAPLLLCVSALAARELPIARPVNASETTPPPPFPLPANLPAVGAIHPLSEAARARLQASGLVALPDQDVERLSQAYFRLFPEEQVSVFITTDVALHLFHNTFDDLLAHLISASPVIEARCNKVYELTHLLAGPADSITFRTPTTSR